MHEFIRNGGWPMFPVMFAGALSLAAAIRYSARPRRELLALVIGLGIATIILGAIGTTLGVQKSVEFIGAVAPSQRWIFLLGLRESLNNLVLALAVAGLDALIATAGAYRMARAVPVAALSPA